jgi:hypothetical protein
LRSASACCAGVNRLGLAERLLLSSLLCKIKLLVEIVPLRGMVHATSKSACQETATTLVHVLWCNIEYDALSDSK